jgi:hypothetical protein
MWIFRFHGNEVATEWKPEFVFSGKIALGRSAALRQAQGNTFTVRPNVDDSTPSELMGYGGMFPG